MSSKPRVGPMDLPALVFGCGVFSAQYNSDDHILSQESTRAIRLALRYVTIFLVGGGGLLTPKQLRHQRL
jgi:hypothetical protein